MTQIKYCISAPNPLNHQLKIRMEVSDLHKEFVQLIYPDWRPGRYQLTNYVSNVRCVNTFDEHRNHLKMNKLTRNIWKVDTSACSTLHVEYTYYAFKMDAGGSVISEHMYYINFINCLFFIKGLENRATEVELDIPEHLEVICPLHQLKRNRFKAPTYYDLVDAPFLAVPELRKISFQIESTNFSIVIYGGHPLSEKKLTDAFEGFTKAQISMFGEFPSAEFTYIIISLPYRFYHGVEHQNSTVITLGPNSADHKNAYFQDLIGVSSHELVHAWNVTRIRPQELLPFDFSKENYYDTGFVTEGFTTYYGDLFLKRGGVITEQMFIDELNKHLKRYFENHGRHEASIVDASFDLWIDGYGTQLPRRKPSIYVKGALIALILDLFIRRSSGNRFALDDVFKVLWTHYGKKSKGYTKSDVFELLQRFGGDGVISIMDKYIEGTEAIETELSELLGHVGFELIECAHPEISASQYGFRIQDNIIKDIAPGSEAETKLSPGDQIVGINGVGVNDWNWPQFENSAIEIELIRNGVLWQNTIELTPQLHYNIYQIANRQGSDETTKINRQLWLGTHMRN